MDDIVPPPSRDPERRSPKRVAVGVALTLAVLAAAVLGVGAWLRAEDDSDSVARAVPEEEVPDRSGRPVEVLGEVLERPSLPVDEPQPTTTVTTGTTVPPSTSTSTTASTTTSITKPRPQDAPPPVDLTVSASGAVVIEQYFSPETKEDFEPNADCGSLHEAYEVVVSDTSGNEIATGALTGGIYEREEEWGWTITRCTYDYAVTVPEADSYVFALAEPWDHRAVKDSATVTAEQLRRDGAPTLATESRYCPECR